MSASIYYRKIQKVNKVLSVFGPSSFIGAMTKAFGPHPWKLNPSHTDVLNGMAAVFTGDIQNPYYELTQIIGDDNAIEVWPEY